ncbi:MAG TPA: hypothetical protein VK137_12520, partial [Planctomycetaceae bacterium]|nr:hypothetical protein [Planctomycetaceae bacterium]
LPNARSNASRRLLLSLLVGAVCGWLIGIAVRTPTAAKGQSLQACGALKWYRGNLHTHSLWSDGDDYLESIALWYREHGYDFLGFTDHNVLADRERWIDIEKSKGKQKAFDKLKHKFPDGWVEERTQVDEQTQEKRHETRLKTFREVADRFNEPGKFLLIQGEEVSDAFRSFPVHMNGTNLRELIVPRHGTSVAETIQNNTDALIAQRERTGQPMIIHLNHPNFGFGVTAEDLMRIRGENFFEVYNGHPDVNNSGNKQHASTDRIWDIINSFRLSELQLPPLFGLGTDDGHTYHNIPSRASEPGRGWVMVLADSLSPESLIAAMEAGRFYASSGVTLERVTSSAEGLEVDVKAEAGVKYTIEFIGTRRGFDSKSEPVLGKDGQEVRATRRYSDEIGAVFSRVEETSASYRFTGDELYVRARVTSSRHHPNPSEVGEFERAWTQPTVGPAAGK